MAGETATATREFCSAPVEPRRALRRTTGRPALGSTVAAPPQRVPLKVKIAQYRKAVVGGIGAVTAAVLPLSPFLPGSVSHWLAAAAAVLTGFATYLTKNAKPTVAEETAVQTVPTSTTDVARPLEAPVSPRVRQTGPVLAGLALIVGGAVLAGRHSERHSRCVSPFALIVPGGS